MNIYLGYDPGGGGSHGVAAIDERGARCATLGTAEDAIKWFRGQSDDNPPCALGVDTLTLWSTGPSGWRPADRALRAAYPNARASIAAPNSLYGAMSVNGAAVALALRVYFPEMQITETHPKVLYRHLAQADYDFAKSGDNMSELLKQWSGAVCKVNSEHEWDALVSAYAAREWHTGKWTADLHALPAEAHERLIPSHGSGAHYAWPTALATAPTSKANGKERKARRSRDRWKVAVEILENAGHDDVAQKVGEYRNARGERSGWDSWLKSSSPYLWRLVEGAED